MISGFADIVLNLKSFSASLKWRSLRLFLTAAVCSMMIASLSGQTGPGGVGNSTNNLLWLKADAGTSTTVDMNPVSSWLDQSGNAMNATQGAANRRPKYVASGANGKPALLLNNQTDGVFDYFHLPSGFSNFTAGLSAFVVVKPNASNPWSNFFNLGGGAPDLWDDAISFSRNDASANIWYEVFSNGTGSDITGGNILNSNYQILAVRQTGGAPPGTSSTRLYLNNTMVAGPLGVQIPRNVLRNDNYIGHDSWGQGNIDAEISEIIIYNYLINDAQRNIIANYLSSKYNLGIGVLTDRYAFDLTHGNDVAGIGRTGFASSHSDATSAGILNISDPSDMDSGDYLLFGHNNGSATSWVSTGAPADIPNMSYLRIGREWRVDKTNDVSTVTITGDFSKLPALTPGYTIRTLLVDSDGDFTSGAVPYALTFAGGSSYEVTDVDLNDGDYLTWAIYNITNDDPCSAYTLSVSGTCNLQLFSNEGASGSAVADPGNCDGSGSSGYSGGDVWFKTVVPPSGNIVINSYTESTSGSNLEWAFRIGIAVYSGPCAGLAKVNCQISPLSEVPPDNVNLSVAGRTPGETLYIRMWEWSNNDNGKFEICIYDPCVLPPVITGSIAPSVIEGCGIGSSPPAVNSVAALEALGLNVSDGCTPDGSLVVTHSDSNTGTCPIVITRTYTITDVNLSSSTYDQIISIDDTQPPVITGTLLITNVEGCYPGGVPVAANSVAGIEALAGAVTINDVCTPDAFLAVSHSDVITGSCPTAVTRTYTISDGCGNTADIVHNIIVDDTQAPVVTGSLLQADIEACNIGAAPAAVNTVAALEALPGGITITDACTPDAALTVSHSDNPSGVCPRVITRTYTVTDGCNNIVDIIHTINIDDTQPPVVTGSLTPATAEGCNAGGAPAAVSTLAALESLPGGITVSDICTPDAALAVSHSDVVSGSCPLVITRTYSVADACGNTVNIVQNITVDDTQAPVVTGSLSASTVEGCNAADAPAAATTVAALEALAGSINIADICTPDASLTVSHSDVTSGSCPIVVTRTYTVTDGCSNFVNISHIINIDDTQSPLVSGAITNTIVEGCNAGAAPAAVTTVAALESLAGGITITDACTPDASLAVVHSDAVAGSCPIVITRTYTVTDECSNSVNIIHIINAGDTQAPAVTGSLSATTVEGCNPAAAPAAATTVAALELLAGAITITDGCISDALLAVSHSDIVTGSCPIVVTRTYTVTDACGNFVDIIHSINIDDSQEPVVTGSLSATTVEGCSTGAAPAAVVTVAALETLAGGITITDACTPDASLAVSHSDAVAGICPIVITRTYTLTDECGNSVNIIHSINIDDSQAPVVTGSLSPLDTEGCNAGAAPAAAATVAGLEALPGSITIADVCSTDASLTVSHSDVPNGTCPIVITRTYTVTDECGNAVNIIHTINVDDTQIPVVTGSLLPVTIEGCTVGSAPAAVTTVAALESLAGGITITDACSSDPSLTVSSDDAVSGSCPIVITRTYTVTDECGNSVNITQTISIDDTQEPVVTGSLSQISAEGCDASDAPAAAATVAELEALAGGITIADICIPDAALSVSHSDAVSGTCPTVIIRTYTVSDGCANSVIITHTINVDDTQAPVVAGALSTTTVEGCNAGAAPAAVNTVTGLEMLAGGITITDACTPDASLTVSFADVVSGTCPIVITRTYTVADECGNSTDIIHTINIDDTQPPVVAGSLSAATAEGCNATSAPVAVTTAADLEALAGGITITDVCTPDAMLTVSHSDDSDGICPIVVTRTYTVTDQCNNSVNIIQTINVDDTQAPVITGTLSETTVEGCDAGAAPAAATTVADLEALAGGVTITDACTPDASISVSHTEAAGGSCPLVVTRTYTVSDACGNSAVIIHTINVDDTQAPVVTGSLSATTVEGCNAGAAPAAATTVADLEGLAGGITITDACTPDASLTVSSADAVSGTCPIVITRTYTVADECGNSTNVVHTINVDDTESPVVTGSLTTTTLEGCDAGTAPAAVATVAALEALAGGITIADACTPDATLTVSHSDVVAGSCPIIVTRTYTITDECNNFVNITHIINIDDTQAPVITGTLSETTVEGCAAGAAPAAATTVADLEALAGGITITDACTPDASISVSHTDAAGGSCPLVVTRTYTVSDACGNSTVILHTINVDDTQAPVVTGSLSATTVEGCNAGAAPGAVTTVADLEGLAGGITITDACTPDASLTVSSADAVSGTCPIVITRTYTVADECGNSTNVVHTINVDDTESPVVTGSLTTTTLEGCDAGTAPAAVATVADLEALAGGITIADACTPNATLTVSHSDVVAGSCPIVVTRIYTITDECNNSVNITHVINIEDTQSPVVTGSLSPVTLEGCNLADAPAAATTVAELEGMTGGITIADACTPDISLAVSHTDVQNGTCPVVVTRTYTVTDECSNAVDIIQTINIEDTQEPVVAGSLSLTFVEGCNIGAIPAAANSVAALESLTGGITITDACTPDAALTVSYSDDDPIGTCPIVITRTYTVMDACGNSVDIIHTINIGDTQAPVITGSLAPATGEGCSAADAPAAVTSVAALEALAGGITVTDNCTPDASMTVNHTDVAAGTCPTVITRTYTVLDVCGNSANVVQTINVDDTQSPLISGSLSVLTAEGCDAAEVTVAETTVAALEALAGGITITDACTPDALLAVSSSDAISGTCPVVITRTYTITDECGNFADIIQTINIDDTQAPVVSGSLSDTTVEGCNTGAAPAAVTSVAELESLAGGITITDACIADASLSVSSSDSNSGSCPVVITRTYTVTDVCGNSVDIIHTINVDDSTAPVFNAPADITIFKDAVCGYDASIAVTGDVTDEADNCDITLDASYTDMVSDGICVGEQVITRTWSLTDDCGNTTTHDQIITARDNTPPSFTVPADIVIYNDASCAYDASLSVTGDVTDEADNCDITLDASHTDVVTDGICEGEHVITRTWSLTDDCGNSTIHIQIITARDNLPPVFTVPSDIYVCRNSDCSYDIDPIITGDVLDELDNCSTGLDATYLDDLSGAADCDKAGIILRRWSLTDKCGNSAADLIQTIYLEPRPSISVAQSDALLCYSGGSVDFNINTTNTLNPGSSWRYDVSVVYPAGVTGDWGAGLSDQTLNILTDNLTNTTDILQSVVYTFTPHIRPGDGGSECQGGMAVIITVALDPQPKITVATDELLCYDGDATFTISTLNTPLYAGSLWRYDVSVVYPAGVTGDWASGLSDQTLNTLTDDLTNSTDIVQTVIYTFTPHIMPGDGGSECQDGVVVIIPVDLDPQPKIAVITDQLLCYDGDATFNISTVNTPLHVGSQWRYDVSVVYPAGVTGSWGSGLTDQTVTTLTDDLTNTSDNVETVVYTFTPHIGPGDGGSECQGAVPFIISVDIDPQPKITVTTDQLLCYDGDATFNISTVHTSLGPGSQWRYDVSVVYPAGVTGNWGSGLTDQTLANLTDNLTNSTAIVQTVIYTFTPHIMPGDAGPECQNGSQVILSVDLDPQPKIAVITDQLLCYDGDATFTISTVNASLGTGSQWRYDVSVVYPAGVTGSWGSGLSDQTVTTLTDNLTNTTDIVQTVVYTFTPHIRPGDAGPECQNGVPFIISVDLDPQPKIAVATDPLLCHDGDAVFNISTVNTVLHAGSQWRYDVSVAYPAGVTGSWTAGLTDQTLNTLTDNLTNTTDNVQTVIYTFTPHIMPGDGGSECQGAVPLIISVDIDPQPKITVTTDQLLCYDGDATFNISTVHTSLGPGSQWRYDVSVVYPAGVTGNWGSGLTNQTLNTLTDNLTNTTDIKQTVVYTFTPHIMPGDAGPECQNGVPVIISVDLDPQPAIAVATDPLLCHDGDAVFNISTVNTALHAGSQWRYDVSVVYPAGVTGNWATGLTDQTLNTLTDNLTNTTDNVQTVIYTFTPHIMPGDGGSECQGAVPLIISVDIDPQPKITVTADQLLCYDGDATFNISTVHTSLGPGSQWRYDVSVVYPAGVTGSWGSGLTNQTAANLMDNLTNNTDILQTVVYTFTPHIIPGDAGSECQNGAAVIITVNLDPQPKIEINTDPLLCFDGVATFNISTVNSSLGTGSQWQYDVSVVYPAGVTGDLATGLTNQLSNVLTDNVTNSTSIVQEVVYTFTPHIKPGDGGSECQSGVPIILTLHHDPRPMITVTTDPLLCFDGDATFNISTGNGALNLGSQWLYDVSVVYPAGVTGDWGAGLSDQTLNILTDNLTNTTDILQSVVYTFTPHIRPGDGGSECQGGMAVIITVALDPQPKITVATDELLCYDGDATFTISTLNTPLYAGSLWRYDVSVVYPAGVTGDWASGLSDQTLNTLTDDLTNSTDIVQTVIYTFTPHIMPGDGGSECQDGVVVIIPVDLDPQPKIAVITDQLLCYDGDATFNISTVNTPLHVGSQWRYDVSVVYPAGVTGSWGSGLTDQTVTTLTDDLTNTSDNVETVVYTFTPHIGPGDGGSECQGAVPFIISVDIDPQPKITVTTDQLLCYDGDATFNISTVHTSLGPGSQWRYDVSVVYPAGVTGNWGSGLTDQTLANLTDNLTNSTAIVQTVIYTFTPHIMPGDAGPECQNGSQVILSVDLDPQPKIAVITDQLLCYDGDATFTISTVNASLGTGSQWRYDVSVVYPAGVTGSWGSGLSDQTVTTLTDNLTNTTDIVQTVVYTFTPHIRPGDAGPECQNGVPFIISVDLDPQPKIAVATDPLLCHDGDAVFNISTVNTVLHAGSQWRYDVSVAYPAGVTGSWTAGLTDQTLNTLTDNLTNTTDNVQTVIYTFTPHIMPGDGGSECQGAVPLIISVDIDPQPKITVTTDQLLCYDGDATFNISTVHTSLGPGSQWRYDVSVVYPAGVTGSWGSGLTNQTAATLIDNLTNTTDLLQTVIYTFTPHITPGDGGSECQGAVPLIISVDLDPQPKINVITDQLLCFDGDATFNISTVNTALHAGSQWRYDVSVVYPAGVTGNWGAGLTDQTLNTLTDNLTNTTDNVQTVIYTFTPHIMPGDGGSECQGAVPVIISVDLDPQPKIAVTTDELLCFDGDAIFNISTVNTPIHSGSQWRYDVSVVYPAGVTGSWAGGLTDQTLNILTDNLTNTTSIVQTVIYTFTPHIQPGDGGTECRNGAPLIVRVDLDPQPNITVTTDPLLCYDGDAIFNISTVNTTLRAGSLWRYDVSVSYPAGVTGSWAAGLTDQTLSTLTDNLTNTTDIVQIVTYTFTPHIRPGDGESECQNGIPVIITVNLDPQPRITVNTTSPLCYDGDAIFNISTVNTILYSGSLWRYNVSVVYPAGVTGSWAAGLTDLTSATITDNLSNNTDVVQTVIYTFTPHIRPGDSGPECQSGIQLVLNVLIDPQPRIFPFPPNTIQCDSTLTNIVLESPNIFSSGFISFDQTVTGDGSITGYSTIPVSGLPNNHIIADRLVNLTDIYNTVTYNIVPVSPTGCLSGTPVNITVTVNPTPRVIPVNTNLKPDSSICFGGSTRVVLTTPTVMTSGSIRFDYTVSVTGAGVVTGNTTPQVDRTPGYVITYPYQNSSDTLQSVYYHITPKVDNAICVPGKIVDSEIKIHARPLQNLIITTPLTCNGGSDAALRAISSKGAGLYYFDWIRPGTDHIFGYGITDLVNVEGGRWDVTVTDNLGCSNSSFIFVSGAYFDSYLYVVDTTGFGTTCPGSNDGEIWIKEKSSSTAIPPFEYWIVRNDQDTVIHSTLPATEVLEKWYNLLPGTYRLILKDANDCINLNYPEAVIAEPDPISVTFSASQYPGNYNISCKGYNDGSAWITAPPTGGNGGYMFKWHTIDGTITGPDTLDRLDSITAGTYYLTITDRKGCVGTDSITMTEPDGMVLSGYVLHNGIDGTFNISCNGGNDGSIILTITGGSGNYAYLWEGPDSFIENTRDIFGLRAGTYTSTVTDVNGCILTPRPQFTLTEPPPINVVSTISTSTDGAYNINCFGGTGSVTVAVTGGITGTYQYEWSTPDGSGIIEGQEDQPALTAGSYHLKITDLNNCESTIDVTLRQPDPIDLDFSVTDITCQAAGFNNGSVDLTVSGGITPYDYLWSNGMVTEDITGLTEGYYRVTVTDVNGCSSIDSVSVNPPPPLTYLKTVSDYNGYQISCNGLADGFIKIEPVSGEAPYNYSWTGPDGFTATEKDISGLRAGNYIMIITDNNFCTGTESIVLTEPDVLGMTVTLSVSSDGGYNINCAGAFTGTIEVEPQNAAGTVDYLWSDGIFGKIRSGLAAGDYTVIISDGNNCHADSTITLTGPDPLTVTYQITPPFCADMPEGQITLNVTGGVPGTDYYYLWSDGSTAGSLTNIPSGKYSVTVSDLNNCQVSSSMNVESLNEICLGIPNAISPNGDLINDFWDIDLIDLYPNAEIVIFNRWGETVWKSERGYPRPWDGRSNGRELPVDSYHYIIDLHDGSKLIIGNVTIVR